MWVHFWVISLQHKQFDKRAHDKMRKLKHHFYQRHGASSSSSSDADAASGSSAAREAARPEAVRRALAKVGSLENLHWKSQGGAPATGYRDRPLPGGDHGGKRGDGAAGHAALAFKGAPAPWGRHPQGRAASEDADQTSVLKEKLQFQKKARAKIGSLDNMTYKSDSVPIFAFTSPPKIK